MLIFCVNRSDADADVLADYVLALLRHDGDVNAVRALCEAEIPDFLKEDSSLFVQDVFDAIQYKTYLPGVVQPPQPSQQPFAPPTGPSAGPGYGLGIPGAPSGPQNGSRKRSYNDAVRDGGPQGDWDYSANPNGRQFKQPRRGGGAFPGRGYANAGNGGPGSAGLQQGFQGLPNPPPGMPALDPNNPMAAMLAMQAMGFPMTGMPPFPPGPSPGGRGGHQGSSRKQRCRDYDQNGFCARGNACMFEHGNDSIYVPPGGGDEYDPANSSLMMGVESSNQGDFSSQRGKGRGRGRGGRGDRGGQYNNPNRRGGRAEFSSDRPNFDKTKTTIVVEQIPEEKFSEEEVRGFFSEFGNIVEISMRPYKRLAIVKFDNFEGAKAAYNSPKVIFDNRFVKVYWYVDQESMPQPPASSPPKPSNGIDSTLTPVPARGPSEPPLDIEEFTRKQQEVQKAYEEKVKKIQNMEVARKELEKRQEDLLKNQAEEKRKLLEKLAAKAGQANASSTTENGAPAPTDAKSSQTETLRAQLAALEAEAMSLGIDPSAEDSSSYRGRGRGRGFRGRGAFIPRGFRGGYRGRGGAAPYTGGNNAYKLDNRPKKIGLTGVDFSNPEKDESLRQYLLVSHSTSFQVPNTKFKNSNTPSTYPGNLLTHPGRW
jgi:RNA-binding protein 26